MAERVDPDSWDRFIEKTGKILTVKKPLFVIQVLTDMEMATIGAREMAKDTLPRPKRNPPQDHVPRVPIVDGLSARERGLCSSCGVPWAEMTPTCETCQARHHRRGFFPPQGPRTECKSCGGHIDDNTPGCYVCERRHYQRNRHAKLRGDNSKIAAQRPVIARASEFLRCCIAFPQSAKCIWWAREAQEGFHAALSALIDDDTTVG